MTAQTSSRFHVPHVPWIPGLVKLFQINRSHSRATVPLDTSSGSHSKSRLAATSIFWLEVFLVLCLLAVYGGQPAPDVNESHYLTKARHFWNPQWCKGDLFLESSNAHVFFFVVFGWITKFASLPGFAWIGRVISWSLVATAWCKLNRTLGIGSGLPILSMLFFLILMDCFHLAGEWVVGGFEAKTVSYGFVLLAIDSFLKRRWNWFWVEIGFACALHVVVGAWTLIAFGIASLDRLPDRIAGRPQDSIYSTIWSTLQRYPSQTATFVIFVTLFLIGALPPLLNNFGVPDNTKNIAAQIQVNQRLGHHLLFGNFPTLFVARFAFLIVMWSIFARLVRFDEKLRRLNLFCFGSLLIAFAGLVLSGVAENALEIATGADSPMDRAGQWSTNLLTLYWFRLADFAVPLALSLTCSWVIASWMFGSRLSIQRIAVVFFGVLILIAGGLMIQNRWSDPRPGADRAALPTYPNEFQRTIETFKNWKKACQWIRDNTPADSVFITPDAQQTFKWYSGRAEVVCWKDAPQDATGVIEWKKRIEIFCDPQKMYPTGLLAYTDSQLIELAQLYGATHMIVPQMHVDKMREVVPFPADPRIQQVYPVDDRRSTYVIFEFGSVPTTR